MNSTKSHPAFKEEKYLNGVKLTVEENYLVPVIESGVIVYIGLKDNLGNTIIVEQVDGIETIYSNIDLLNYKLYDYVEKGELIGETINKNLILQFQKNGEYVLHRVIKVGKSYTCIGDNQFEYEHGIEHRQMIGVVTAFVNGKKETNYIAITNKKKMFSYDEIDDRFGYVVGFLNPDGSWGER